MGGKPRRKPPKGIPVDVAMVRVIEALAIRELHAAGDREFFELFGGDKDMGGKPRKKPERTPEEYRKIIGELGTCVLWALKFLDVKGDGLMGNPSTGDVKVWTEKFMDALDGMGHELDRAAFYEIKDKKRKRR